MAARDLDENRQELARAIEDIDMKRVRELLDAGDIDLNAPLDGNGRTYLLMAAEYGSDEMLEMVLEAGANPDQPNNYGTTPMHLCAQMGISTKLRSLLEAGASLNPKTKTMRRPCIKRRPVNATTISRGCWRRERIAACRMSRAKPPIWAWTLRPPPSKPSAKIRARRWLIRGGIHQSRFDHEERCGIICA